MLDGGALSDRGRNLEGPGFLDHGADVLVRRDPGNPISGTHNRRSARMTIRSSLPDFLRDAISVLPLCACPMLAMYAIKKHRTLNIEHTTSK